MKRVTAIGGVFFKCKDPDAQKAWYEKHLGIPFKGNTYAGWPFSTEYGKLKSGYNVLSFFKNDAAYFNPSDKPVMINFIVEDLLGLLAVLEEEGVTIVDKPMVEDYGKFGWILDPEGNKIELWELPANQ